MLSMSARQSAHVAGVAGNIGISSELHPISVIAALRGLKLSVTT